MTTIANTPKPKQAIDETQPKETIIEGIDYQAMAETLADIYFLLLGDSWRALIDGNITAR